MAASKNFIYLHLLLPGDWTITQGHEITKEIENYIKLHINNPEIFIHMEPLDDPDSFDDYLT
jgi:divalent metal cation (Fe/Co/Zn/Cd) transporter